MHGDPDRSADDSGATDPRPTATPPPAQPSRLSVTTRFVLLGGGWILVVIGIVGLALPGLQGILTLLLGGALLSVASASVHRLLHRLLHRWPSVWDRFEHFRQKTHDKLARQHDPDDPDDPDDRER